MKEIDVSPEVFRALEQAAPHEEVVLREWCERLDQRARFNWGVERTPEELAAHDTGYTGRRKRVVVASSVHSGVWQKIGAEIEALANTSGGKHGLYKPTVKIEIYEHDDQVRVEVDRSKGSGGVVITIDRMSVPWQDGLLDALCAAKTEAEGK